MDVIELDSRLPDPPGMREMPVEANFPTLAKDLCDLRHRPWRLYVAIEEKVVGLLEGRFDYEFGERFKDERFAAAGHQAPQAFISHIVVDPALRRDGIGSALIKRFVANATEHGCTYIGLEVNLQDGSGLNTRLAFFRSRGFIALTKINELPDIMGTPIEILNETMSDGS